MPKLNDTVFVCGYPNYNGKGTFHRKNTPDYVIENTEFHQRLFADCHAFTDDEGKAAFERTPQNFFTDSYLELLKKQNPNCKVIWCAQAPLRNQLPFVKGNKHKTQPIKDGDDPLDPASWEAYAEFCLQLVLRYQRVEMEVSSQQEIYDRIDISGVPINGEVQEKHLSLGLIDALEVLNEPNFKKGWANANTGENDKEEPMLTPEGAATCFRVVHDKIRPYSNIPLIAPGPIGADLDWQDDFWRDFFRQGGLSVGVLYANFHWYFRDGSIDQGEGTRGISPEEADIWVYAEKMEKLCSEWVLDGWYCTETGHAANDPVVTTKQSTPIQAGKSQLESQGLMAQRTALIWSCFPNFKGVAFYHCRDGYDGEPYNYCGFNDIDWEPKPVRWMLREFNEQFGDIDFKEFEPKAGYLIARGGKKSLAWSDGEDYSNLITVTPSETQETEEGYLIYESRQARKVLWENGVLKVYS